MAMCPGCPQEKHRMCLLVLAEVVVAVEGVLELPLPVLTGLSLVNL